MNFKKLYKITTAIFLGCCFVVCSSQEIFARSVKLSSCPQVKNFIHCMVIKHQFNRRDLTKLLDNTALMPNIISPMRHPYEEQPWYIYRRHLVSQKRIDLGKKYWQRHKQALHYAAKKYGVPASIIVAIVGIESMYGKSFSNHPVLNALVTLSFAYPPRASFFQSELEQYLLLTRELALDPKTIFGSYAGAIGLPQFMPSSYRHFAISYEPNKTAATKNANNSKSSQKLGNLIDDTDDVIVSVANYLHHFGWIHNGKVAVRCRVKGDKYQALLDNKLAPKFTVAQLRKKYHIIPLQKISPKTKVFLVRMQTKKHGKNKYAYWLAANNFYTLLKYNGSAQYVMAVYQLATSL